MSRRDVPESTNLANGPESESSDVPAPSKPGGWLRMSLALIVGVVSIIAVWYFSTHPQTWTTEAEKFFTANFTLFLVVALGYLAWRAKDRYQWRHRYG